MKEPVMLASQPGTLLRRATVLEADGPAIHVLIDDDESELDCAVLFTSAVPLLLERGDTVLVWQTSGETPAVVLGRIGPAARSHEQESEGMHDTLTIEAQKTLTLRVGDGSITIREDGRILIKGKDLVSQAKRRNRIRGGSVEIN